MSQKKNSSSFQYTDVFPLLRGRVPGQLVIQYTDRCNATCPQCSMRVGSSFTRSKLSLDNAKRIIDQAAANGVKAISLTGGEPMLFLEELIQLIKYAGTAGIPYVRTGTNGFIFRRSEREEFSDRIRRIAEQLAETPLRNFWISIDSADPSVHEEMRGLPGVIGGIEKALPIFHEYGIYPAANLGINRNAGGLDITLNPALAESSPETYYISAVRIFRKFYNFVADLGFTMVNACYPMSLEPQEPEGLNPVYGAASADQVVRFTGAEKILIFRALLNIIPEYRPKIRIFTPRSSLYALIKQYEGQKDYGAPCQGGIGFFYVNAADCDTYPCGYRGGENLGKFWDLDLRRITARAYCRECDWECFRDPSELIAPIMDLLRSPLNLAARFRRDREYFKIWLDDISYCKACDFFDGRKPYAISTEPTAEMILLTKN